MKRLVIHDGEKTSRTISSLDDDALAILTPTPAACPALEVLEMHNCFLISDAALLRLITSRMESASKLKRVQVTFTREMTLDILPPLQPFIKNGLDISVVHTSTQRFPVHFSPWEGLSDASNF
ncbi:hypothetical protein B0H16DRAFT_1563013 [Mycena metata]|uniref:Uncharacterized protein n=1 Tax=Mycena metata TaxID=1033252 RepID=A0AAD7IGF8_9AGAR|nr:hypothetical protein B0H16DRAFT_1563013 [Mycena metata]